MLNRLLRPPGAVPEKDFLHRCIQCGQCAQACPFDCITLKTGWFHSGTPVIDPRVSPCKLCMRCSAICPSDALEDVPIEKSRMGLAKLNKDECHTWMGFILCRSCFERCPLKGKAILLDKGIYPVITDQCVGCGICEYVCPKKAIVTVPARLMVDG